MDKVTNLGSSSISKKHLYVRPYAPIIPIHRKSSLAHEKRADHSLCSVLWPANLYSPTYSSFSTVKSASTELPAVAYSFLSWLSPFVEVCCVLDVFAADWENF